MASATCSTVDGPSNGLNTFSLIPAYIANDESTAYPRLVTAAGLTVG